MSKWLFFDGISISFDAHAFLLRSLGMYLGISARLTSQVTRLIDEETPKESSLRR